MAPRLSPAPKVFHKTALGRIVNGDSLDVLATYTDKTGRIWRPKDLIL
jgi:hypothetical protein